MIGFTTLTMNGLTQIGLTHYLVVSTVVFCLGIAIILTRRNAIAVLMGIELVINASALNFVAFSHFNNGGQQGQVVALFVIMLAAAEAAVALAIILNVYRIFDRISLDQLDQMRE